MTLHGADVFIRTPEMPELPPQIGPFSLTFISSRGTRIYPPPAPHTAPNDWPQCRFLSEEVVTDVQVDELVSHLTELGWQWTKLQKLFKIDGVNAFSMPY